MKQTYRTGESLLLKEVKEIFEKNIFSEERINDSADCWRRRVRKCAHQEYNHCSRTRANSVAYPRNFGPVAGVRTLRRRHVRLRVVWAHVCHFCAHPSWRAAVLACLLGALARFSSAPLFADEWQTFQYVDVRLINGPCCTDEGTDLVVDDEGSILLAGYRGSLDFNRDGRIDMPTFGRPDAFVSKVTLLDGENTGWNRGPGGPKLDRADGIAPDREGGVFVVGSFTDSLQMTETTTLQSAGGVDGFLARYGRDSKLMWGRAIVGTGQDWLRDVASDSKGNVFLIGYVGGPVDVDRDGTIDVRTEGGVNALVVSYTPDGELRWLLSAGESVHARGASIVIGQRDEVYIAGSYGPGAPDFDGDGAPDLPIAEPTEPEVVALNDAGLYQWNGFYARLENDGTPRWVKGVSGNAVQAVGSLSIAANGDLLVLGGYTAPPDFNGDGVADLEYRSIADRVWRYDLNANTFLMQVTPDGERVWAKRYTAPARHVVANNSRIVLSGAYSGLLDVDDDGIAEREADDDEHREGFAMLLDAQGEVQQVLTVVGQHHDVVNAAGFAPDGKTLYLTGYTSLGADFNDDGEVETASICHKAGELYLALFELRDTD